MKYLVIPFIALSLCFLPACTKNRRATPTTMASPQLPVRQAEDLKQVEVARNDKAKKARKAAAVTKGHVKGNRKPASVHRKAKAAARHHKKAVKKKKHSSAPPSRKVATYGNSGRSAALVSER